MNSIEREITRIGVISFIPSLSSRLFTARANEILSSNDDDLASTLYLTSQNISISSDVWRENISEDGIKKIKEYNDKNLNQNLLESVSQNNIQKYYLLENFTQDLSNIIPLSNLMEWESIFAIEPAMNNREDRKTNCYNYISTNVRETDKDLQTVSIRSTLTRSSIRYDNRIYSEEYQSHIRKKYNLEKVPLKISIKPSPTSQKKHLLYLLMMEDVTCHLRRTKLGPYIYIRIENNPLPKFTLTENNNVYVKAGVMPFINRESSLLLCRSIDTIMACKINRYIVDIQSGSDYHKFEEEDRMESLACISRSIFRSEDILKTAITSEQIDRLTRLSNVDLAEEHRNLLDQEWTKNNLLKHLIEQIKYVYRDYYEVSRNWENLMIVEPIRQRTLDRYKNTHYGYFCSGIDKKDRSILDAAKRETKEEGSVVFSDKIYAENYQREIRRRFGIKDMPLYVDIQFIHQGKRINRYTRVYLLFMDNIIVTNNIDNNGELYCKVDI